MFGIIGRRTTEEEKQILFDVFGIVGSDEILITTYVKIAKKVNQLEERIKKLEEEQ